MAAGPKGVSEGGISSTAGPKISTDPLFGSIEIDEPSSVKRVSKLARGEAKPKRVYKGLSNFGKAKNSKDPQNYQSKPLNFSLDHAFGRPTQRDDESIGQIMSYQYEKDFISKLENERLVKAMLEKEKKGPLRSSQTKTSVLRHELNQLRRNDLEKSPSKGALNSQASGGAP